MIRQPKTRHGLEVRHGIARRSLLRGIGVGAALLGPFARNRLADAAPAGNFMFFVTPNGHVRDQFGGEGSGANWTFKPSLAGLTPYKSDITVIRGLCNKSASTFNSHEDMCKLLTCVHGDGDRYKVNARSFDHMLGEVLHTRPLTLAVPPLMKYPDVPNLVSWVAAGKSDALQTDPLKAYMAAFGASMPAGVTDEAAAQMLDRRKSVLDFVREDIGVFKRRLAAKDAENLDFYLDGIRSLESKLGSAPELLAAGAACSPGPVQSAAAGATSVAGDLARFKAMGEAMLDVVSMGFACGSLRVATMVWQPGSYGINPASGSFANTREHHDISHTASARSKWAEIDRWYADRFAYLVKRLKDLQVLDRTAAVCVTDISEAHNSNDFVNVVAGGRSLGIKSNQNIVYPFYYPNLAQGEALKAARDARHKSLADLWVSVQKALGKRDDHFGDLQYSNGGLQELYAG